MTRPYYPTTPVDRPYWAAGHDGRLHIPKCGACGHMFFPPGPRCVQCGSTDVGLTPVSGRGKIWSWVEFHRPYFKGMPAPYICIRVQLEEGPALITNLVDAGDRRPQVDDEVKVVIQQDGDVWLPQFTYA